MNDCDIDDRAGAACTHHRNHLATTQKDPGEIDPNRVIPCRPFDVLGVTMAANPRTIDKDVETAMSRDDMADCRTPAIGLAHVENHMVEVRDRVGLADVLETAYHRATFSANALCGGEPNTTAGTGDERDLILKTHACANLPDRAAATVYCDRLPGHEAGVVRGKKRDRGSDVRGFSIAPQWVHGNPRLTRGHGIGRFPRKTA